MLDWPLPYPHLAVIVLHRGTHCTHTVRRHEETKQPANFHQNGHQKMGKMHLLVRIFRIMFVCIIQKIIFPCVPRTFRRFILLDRPKPYASSGHRTCTEKPVTGTVQYCTCFSTGTCYYIPTVSTRYYLQYYMYFTSKVQY